MFSNKQSNENFNPYYFGNDLHTWVDLREIAYHGASFKTVTEAAGKVSAWKNKGYTGINLTETVGSYQPDYISVDRLVRFNGINQGLRNTNIACDLTGTLNVTLCIKFRFLTVPVPPNYMCVFYTGVIPGGSGARGLEIMTSATNAALKAYKNSNGAGAPGPLSTTITLVNTPVLNQWYNIIVTFIDSTKTLRGWVNGAQVLDAISADGLVFTSSYLQSIGVSNYLYPTFGPSHSEIKCSGIIKRSVTSFEASLLNQYMDLL